MKLTPEQLLGAWARWQVHGIPPSTHVLNFDYWLRFENEQFTDAVIDRDVQILQYYPGTTKKLVELTGISKRTVQRREKKYVQLARDYLARQAAA